MRTSATSSRDDALATTGSSLSRHGITLWWAEWLGEEEALRLIELMNAVIERDPIIGFSSAIDRESGLELEAFTGREPIAAMKESVFVPVDASPAELRSATAKVEKQVAVLKAENTRLQDASGSWVYQSRAFASTLGVTFGWSGVYFTLLAGACGGRTVGKLLLRIRAVKTNGMPFTFFDGFVRHGGYVAGVAMGLTGFLRLLWEPNRQAVEDRIAGTIVVKA